MEQRGDRCSKGVWVVGVVTAHRTIFAANMYETPNEIPS